MTTSHGHRLAIKITVLLSIVSGLLLIGHFVLGILSDRAAAVMAVGVVFWLVMAQGYRADLKERMAGEDDGARSREPGE